MLDNTEEWLDTKNANGANPWVKHQLCLIDAFVHQNVYGVLVFMKEYLISVATAL